MHSACGRLEHHLGLASSGTKQVTDAYFHAITARWPQIRYQIGLDGRFIWMFSALPTAVQLLLFRIVTFFEGPPAPVLKGAELLKTIFKKL